MTAAEAILNKAILPTHLDSAEIRAQIAAEVRRRSIFSSEVSSAKYLERLREVFAKLASGEWNDTKAREVLQRELDVLGYGQHNGPNPEEFGLVQPPEKGSLKDLASRARIQLQLETNVRQARSVAQAKAGSTPSALAQFPAWKLVRIYGRQIPRDWAMRWQAAGDSVGWEGAAKGYPGPTGEPRMIALKSSPIWQAIGAGAGGYDDTQENPYPPFAFGSGLGWLEATADEAKEVGLGASGPSKVELDPGEMEIAAALERLGPAFKKNLLKSLGGAA